jgi:large conductance mechanosensitive channel
MPPIGLLLGNVDFSSLFVVLKQGKIPGPYITLAEAKAAGAVTMNYGLFFNTIISFLIIAFAIFMVVKSVNRMKKDEQTPPPAPATKECPLPISDPD